MVDATELRVVVVARLVVGAAAMACVVVGAAMVMARVVVGADVVGRVVVGADVVAGAAEVGGVEVDSSVAAATSGAGTETRTRRSVVTGGGGFGRVTYSIWSSTSICSTTKREVDRVVIESSLIWAAAIAVPTSLKLVVRCRPRMGSAYSEVAARTVAKVSRESSNERASALRRLIPIQIGRAHV